MNVEVETHCHTIASGHAYSTLMEIVTEGKKKGLKGISLTDHGPNMPGGPNVYHILNQRVIPNEIEGIKILKGVEANIIDYDGKLDIEDDILEKLDLVIASLHNVCIPSSTIENNTNAIIKAMENPNVDIIGHLGNPFYQLNYEEIVKKAVETNTLIEVNNSSFLTSRVGSRENCSTIVKLCKKYGAKITMGSDAHIAFDIGRTDKSSDLIEEIGYDKDLIMNLKIERLMEFLGK